ncbi:MAG: hypothetical protein AAF558_12270 [Verrucomicrobiota bacterium]
MKSALKFFGGFLVLLFVFITGVWFGHSIDEFEDQLGFKSLHFGLVSCLEHANRLETKGEINEYLEAMITALNQSSWQPSEYIGAIHDFSGLIKAEPVGTGQPIKPARESENRLNH